jgi:hypothetical protein
MLRLADSSFEREALVSCKVRFRRGIGQLDAGEIKSADPKSANTKFAIPCAVFGAVFATADARSIILAGLVAVNRFSSRIGVQYSGTPGLISWSWVRTLLEVMRHRNAH